MKKAGLSLFYVVILLFFTNTVAAVLVKDKQWPNGLVLNVVFIGGEQKTLRLIKKTAPLWLDNTGLSFRFYDNLASAPKQTHIRVGFNTHTGSVLGNHRDYESKYPTMNLFDLTTGRLSDKSSFRLILHEFGHALGFEHEYRNRFWPYGNQPINSLIKGCYPKMKLIGYSKMSAYARCQKINAPITDKSAFLTAYDETSIMNYPMSFTLDDGKEKNIEASNKLSFLDLNAIQRWYPKLTSL